LPLIYISYPVKGPTETAVAQLINTFIPIFYVVGIYICAGGPDASIKVL